MTDHDDTADELASAYLDEELSVEERARSVDETVLGRVDDLAMARDALQAMTAAVDPRQREVAVGAAMAAFDADLPATRAAPGASATVSTMAGTAARHRARRMARLVGVAAAVALAALLVPFLGHLDSGSDDVAGRGDATGSADQTLRADAPAAGAVAPESMALAPASVLEDLGSFGDVADLARAVRTRVQDAAAADSSPPDEAVGGRGSTEMSEERCAAERAETAPVVFAAVAELDGRPVLVLVRADEHGHTLVALDMDSCAVVVTRGL